MQNPSPNLPKTIPNLPRTLPKSSPNPPKSKEIESAATKMKKVKKKEASLNDCKALGPFFGGPMPPKRGPRASPKQPKWSQKRKKNDVEKQVVFRLDFCMVWRWFVMVFWMIFGSQTLPKLLKHRYCENLKNSDFP